MITLKVEKENSELTQETYDSIIRSIDIHSLECTCGRHDMVVHGYYSHCVKTKSGVIKYFEKYPWYLFHLIFANLSFDGFFLQFIKNKLWSNNMVTVF